MKNLLLAFLFIFLINGCESKDEKAIDLKKGEKTWGQGVQASVDNNYTLAWEYFKKSCEENYARGCFEVANAYEFGEKHEYTIGREARISVDKNLLVPIRPRWERI